MLPKIPYKMEKNKSQSIPMRSINLGSAAEVGELSDSLGISTRKFPYLTVRREDSELDEYEGVKAMTVFGGELVTVRADGIYVGGKKVGSSGIGETKNMAPINAKLVIIPDNLFLEKEQLEEGDQRWKVKNLGSEINAGMATFSTNSLNAAGTQEKIAEGIGGQLYSDGRFYIHSEQKKEDLDANYYFDSGSSEPIKVVHELPGGWGDKPPYFKTDGVEYLEVFTYAMSDDQHDAILRYKDDINEILFEYDGALYSGYVRNIASVTIELYEGAAEDGIPLLYRMSFSITLPDGIDPNLIADNTRISRIYWLGGKSHVDFDDTEASSLSSTVFSRRKGTFAIVTTDAGEKILSGTVVEFAEGSAKLERCIISEEYDKKIFSGKFNVEFPGWSVMFDEISLEVGDQIVISESDAIFTIEKIAGNNLLSLTSENNYEAFDVTDKTVTIYKQGVDGAVVESLKVGDAVEISGCSIDENNTTFVISEIKGDTLYAAADIFTEGVSASKVTVSRKIPHLDFICEKDNRLYGVNNSEKTIYVSALGDPTNMYAYEGLSTDSFAVAVGGEGDFTGCCKYGEAVLFFKEDMLYKLVGSSPLDFALYSYNVDGIERGSEKSCVVINEVLYYKGRQGVYAYTGGVPVLISECFGERRFSEGVGGTDGRYYYLSVIDEEKKPYLFTYDTRTQLWLIEEKVRCVDFARTKEGLRYVGEDGCVYAVGAGQPSGEWLARWAPIYELIDGKRSYSRILVRVSLPRGSYIIVKIRCDGGEWREAGKIVGKTEAVVPIRIPINRCDKFELELSGRGECTILDIMREFYVGSEV